MNPKKMKRFDENSKIMRPENVKIKFWIHKMSMWSQKLKKYFNISKYRQNLQKSACFVHAKAKLISLWLGAPHSGQHELVPPPREAKDISMTFECLHVAVVRTTVGLRRGAMLRLNFQLQFRRCQRYFSQEEIRRHTLINYNHTRSICSIHQYTWNKTKHCVI